MISIGQLEIGLISNVGCKLYQGFLEIYNNKMCICVQVGGIDRWMGIGKEEKKDEMEKLREDEKNVKGVERLKVD